MSITITKCICHDKASGSDILLVIKTDKPLVFYILINFHYCIKKAVLHAISSHVLTGKNPCINQAIYVLLMHGFCTLHIHILGRHKN